MLELAETFAYEAHEYRPASFMPISCIGAVWRRGRWSTMVEGSGVRTPMPKLSFNKKIKISNKEFDGQTERRFADFWPTKNQSKSRLHDPNEETQDDDQDKTDDESDVGPDDEVQQPIQKKRYNLRTRKQRQELFAACTAFRLSRRVRH